ncbi:hypothetical protein J6TS1_02230 [Siminovitchia terrae]|uniref:YfzA-like protein n=1 Tax=Siminovitchia terrae TaxID=1914933 RepID=A0ABQ4KQP1_SIMTE|nr:YfzA family protein [Siminovitchia terrae]GIN90130.1 hypothetical protein J22TS1_11810 [Siminovitchia terrae]GIN94353.1 hypothetical protein J6TS1_02230 [Siminovitchia terrae]
MDDFTVKEQSFSKKSWVLSISSFVLIQIVFLTMEFTGWIPNLKDIDGTVFGKIAGYTFMEDWFNFYETPYFNVCTFIFGIVLLSHGLIGALRDVFSK